jgi:hypothetical protein
MSVVGARAQAVISWCEGGVEIGRHRAVERQGVGNPACQRVLEGGGHQVVVGVQEVFGVIEHADEAAGVDEFLVEGELELDHAQGALDGLRRVHVGRR